MGATGLGRWQPSRASHIGTEPGQARTAEGEEMTRAVALLRAVNVGGRKLAMAALREACADLGWEDVATYIQSGNLVFLAKGRPAALETALEQSIGENFGLEVPVIVRTAA